MACTNKAAEDILNSCDDIPISGYEPLAWMLNRSDIDVVTYGTSENIVTNITLKSGSAYSVTAVKKEANGGFDLEQGDDVPDTFLNHFSFKPYEKDGESIVNMDSMQDLVIIAELKGEKSEGCFVIYGLGHGLYKNAAANRQNDNHGLPIYEMQSQEGQGEKYSRYIFWDTDYATTKAKIETLTGYSAEYQPVYDAMTSKPSGAIATAQDLMVRAMVDAGVWAKLDAFYVFAQHINSGGEALINWMNPGTWDAVLGGTPNPSFVALEGITGDGANGYADLIMAPDDGVNFQLDSGCIGVYSRTDEAASTSVEMGSYQSGSTITHISCRFTGDELEGTLNNTSNGALAVVDSLGFNAFIRRDSANVIPYKNGTEGSGTARASVGRGNLPFYVCAERLGGSAANFSTKQISMAFIASGLAESELDDFFTAFETYMDYNGKGVVT